MPSYTVPIDGPNGKGFITVNASSPSAAIENASQGGDHATGTPIEGGHQATSNTPGGVATALPGLPTQQTTPTQTQTTNANSSSLQQLGNQINSLIGAIASGNKQAFDEAVRQFNVSFGLDTSKFQESIRQFNENLGIAQAGVTGTFQGAPTQQAILQAANIAAQQAGLTGTFGGAPTLAAQNQYATLYGGAGAPPTPGQTTLAAQQQYAQMYGNAGQAPSANQTTLAAQQQAYAQQLGLINQAASLQANPFRQQQALGQMGRLLGGQSVAGFAAPQTVQGVGTAGGNTQGGMGYLQQMIDDIQNPAANQHSMQQVMDGIPTPTKLDSVQFFKAPTSTQNLVLQGMQEKYGLDPADSLNQIKNTLPGFQSPATFGTVRRPTF